MANVLESLKRQYSHQVSPDHKLFIETELVEMGVLKEVVPGRVGCFNEEYTNGKMEHYSTGELRGIWIEGKVKGGASWCKAIHTTAGTFLDVPKGLLP
ncbi:hypothetical protein LCGC14_1369600 [marine sediment metagenome]|uniref:Uncharacterized protein n=1 Tax=marine sediment metagenome TaxID=412755 RepID=A0A0F9N7Q8_9ZZZZ